MAASSNSSLSGSSVSSDLLVSETYVEDQTDSLSCCHDDDLFGY